MQQLKIAALVEQICVHTRYIIEESLHDCVESGVGHSVLLHCNPKCKLWSVVQNIWSHYTKGNCHKFNMNNIHVIPLSF